LGGVVGGVFGGRFGLCTGVGGGAVATLVLPLG
jgi:hypothetical protein